MEQYSHEPLREPWDGQLEIRVLTLQPGKIQDDVQINLAKRVIPQHPQDGNVTNARSEPTWEALSYCWGDMADSKAIYVEVDDHRLATLDVGLNLFAALQRLRSESHERVLWIDAICIDQSGTPQSKKEKSHQIPAMLEIYQLSSAVIVWLGEESHDSDLALHFLKRLGESFEHDWTTYEMVSTSKLQPATLTLLQHWDSQFSWTTPEYQAVCSLFARDWFGRVWTRQEAFAGPPSSTVMCGSTSVSLSEFRTAIHLIGVKGFDVRDPEHETNLANLGRAIAVLEKHAGGYSTILDLMSKIRGGLCKEPQDKIYGCLGMIKLLVNRDFAQSIPTDYPNTVELFKKFFLLYFKRYNTLRLLESGGLCQQSSLDGPSWLPDWTTDVLLLDQRMDCAVSHAMASEATYDGGDILSVVGIIAATVSDTDLLHHPGDLSADNFAQSYAGLARLMREHLSPGNEKQLEAFVRAFTVPLNGLRIPPDEVEKRRVDYKALAMSVMETGNVKQALADVTHGSQHHFDTCIRYFQQRKSPFTFTSDGYVGVSCVGALPGDCISAVLGMNNLLLLRPTQGQSGKQNQYQLVGSCSVHGLNWGEALLGPLPAKVTVVPNVNRAVGNIIPFYQDTETGQSTFWDPRIEGPSSMSNPPMDHLTRSERQRANQNDMFLPRTISRDMEKS